MSATQQHVQGNVHLRGRVFFWVRVSKFFSPCQKKTKKTSIMFKTWLVDDTFSLKNPAYLIYLVTLAVSMITNYTLHVWYILYIILHILGILCICITLLRHIFRCDDVVHRLSMWCHMWTMLQNVFTWELCVSIITPLCLFEWPKCAPSEAEIVRNGTTSHDLHCRNRVHFQSLENIDCLLVFIMSNAISVIEQTFGWCMWNLAATVLLTGSL